MTDSDAIAPDLTPLIQHVLQTGQINRQEHFQLVTRCLTEPTTPPEQRRQINQILDQIQMGKIQIYSTVSQSLEE